MATGSQPPGSSSAGRAIGPRRIDSSADRGGQIGVGMCLLVAMPRSQHPSSAKALPDEVDTLKALVLAERDENDRLRDIIKALQRARFGRSSETLDPEQLRLVLGIEDQVAANDDRGGDEGEDGEASKQRRKKRRGNRGCLPPHLPRIEEIIEPESTICPCCQGAMHMIGEAKSERLDVIPAQFRVIVTRRPKYGCRRCESAILQAPAPARLIEGGMRPSD